LQRKVITTADGSSTIQIEDWNEQYHSVHGAIQEANHVYIKHGFLFYCETENNLRQLSPEVEINILEIGFGTGLNALLTLLKSEDLNLNVNYTGVEAYPISTKELDRLNYTKELEIKDSTLKDMHDLPWEIKNQISESFSLKKQQGRFENISEKNKYDVIYFDAFGPRVQPELWTEQIFKKMYLALRKNGVLSTYSAKGSVRRNFKSVGFEVERLQGPPGKRHMLRAVKR